MPAARENHTRLILLRVLSRHTGFSGGPESGLEAVADALDGCDLAARRAELRAQPAHVYVDGARFDLVGARIAPHAVEQEFAREHAAGRRHQRVQEIEFL